MLNILKAITYLMSLLHLYNVPGHITNKVHEALADLSNYCKSNKE